MVVRLRTVETPEGIGSVAGPKIADVRARYSLRIQREFEDIGDELVPGVYQVGGTVKPLDMDVMVLMKEDNLVLTLSDGRKMGFYIKNVGGDISLREEMTLLEGLETRGE